MVFPSGNTGITGGIHGINNKVPTLSLFR
jgi:hypothetical protein